MALSRCLCRRHGQRVRLRCASSSALAPVCVGSVRSPRPTLLAVVGSGRGRFMVSSCSSRALPSRRDHRGSGKWLGAHTVLATSAVLWSISRQHCSCLGFKPISEPDREWVRIYHSGLFQCVVARSPSNPWPQNSQLYGKLPLHANLSATATT